MLEQSPTPIPRGLAPLDRLSLLTSLVLVGLTFSLVLDLPAYRVEFSFLGSEGAQNGKDGNLKGLPVDIWHKSERKTKF